MFKSKPCHLFLSLSAFFLFVEEGQPYGAIYNLYTHFLEVKIHSRAGRRGRRWGRKHFTVMKRPWRGEARALRLDHNRKPSHIGQNIPTHIKKRPKNSFRENTSRFIFIAVTFCSVCAEHTALSTTPVYNSVLS